jgi:hypothetical protein
VTQEATAANPTQASDPAQSDLPDGIELLSDSASVLWRS